jgi:putative ABC transport system permease protein
MLRTALKFIVFDKAKSLGALLGIVISVFLIGQQTGIFLFLTGAMSRLVDNSQAALWVVDSKTTNVNALGQIDARLVRQIESIPGVARVYPLVMGGGSAKFEGGASSGVTLVGSQAPHFKGGPWNVVEGSAAALVNEGAVTTDVFDSRALSNISYGDHFEIGGKRAYVAAQTSGARGFGSIYMFTTLERTRYLAKIPHNKVSAVLVDVLPDADPLTVRERINASIYGAQAWTREDFARATVKTVLSSSGIAMSIGTMIIFAVISGLVIIGLTLYSSAIDRIRDYATLKAIGATNGFITRLILLQALILAIFGYGIASLLLEGFRNGIANTGTFFQYSPALRLGFFVLTLLISLCGAVFAIRRINSLEPATVFRG